MTRDWSKRINISLLSICIVDTWLAYTGILQEETKSIIDTMKWEDREEDYNWKFHQVES